MLYEKQYFNVEMYSKLLFSVFCFVFQIELSDKLSVVSVPDLFLYLMYYIRNEILEANRCTLSSKMFLKVCFMEVLCF